MSLERGNAEIRPEPTAEEREALLQAVDRLLAEEAAGAEPPAWWRAGAGETLDENGERA